MSITEIKNTMVLPEFSGGPNQQQKPNVSLVNERQIGAVSGKQQPPPADVAELQAQLKDASELISNLVQSVNLDSDLQFKVDDSTGANIISVLDGKTGEVIRRFPSEESMAIARYIAEFAEAPKVGLLMDQTE
ncbi:MAG: flagellar protein FlaG [Halioglobus sp.]